MTRRPISQEDAEQIVKLYKKGLSRVEVQIETGITQPTIRKILAKAGFPPNEIREPTKITSEIRDAIIAAHNAGMSAGTISEKFGIAKRTALTILKDGAEQLTTNTRSDVSPMEFIKAWQESDNADEVAAMTGLSLSIVYQRAYQYRAKGVPLKRYKFGNRYDWEELKEFAELFDLTDDNESE
jgi:transposase